MKYAKAIAAIVGAAVTTALGLGLTGTWQQVLTIVAALVTAAGVYAVPNTPAVPDAVKAVQAAKATAPASDGTGDTPAA